MGLKIHLTASILFSHSKIMEEIVKVIRKGAEAKKGVRERNYNFHLTDILKTSFLYTYFIYDK
jgi:hypothetical protein